MAGKSYEWKVLCPVCGLQKYADQMFRRWDGQWVCKEDYETRHPSELYRQRDDTHNLPFRLPDDPGVEQTNAVQIARLTFPNQQTAPAVPASTVNQSNTFKRRMQVFVYGGTVTTVTVRGVDQELKGGTFILEPGDNINITYSVAPSWVWYG